jgi:hypothetical protein
MQLAGAPMGGPSRTPSAFEKPGFIIAVASSGIVLLSCFLPFVDLGYGHTQSFWTFMDDPRAEFLELLPAALVAGAGILGLTAVRYRRACAGVIGGAALAPFAGWLNLAIRFHEDLGIGFWVFILGFAAASAVGIVLLVQSGDGS